MRRCRRKQRHTTRRIYERLRDEHDFAGGYTIVKDYVRLIGPEPSRARSGGADPRVGAQNRANLYAKPFASHETAVELVLAVEEDVVPPDRADMGQ